MPWPERQRRAIFLRIARTQGIEAARRFMHEHGYGGKRKKKRNHGAEVDALARRIRRA